MTRTSLSRLMHQALGWALALLLGSAPLAPLLALSSEPDCQMACCDRKHHSDSCARHQTDAPSATPIHFEASTTCPSDCSCAGIAPSASDHVLVSPRSAVGLTSVEDGELRFIPASAFHSDIDPSLYQRPPPLPV